MVDDIDPAVPAWLAAFAEQLGVPAPTDDEFATLLELAGIAARGSARQAAPIACWLVARAGVTPTHAAALAAYII